MSAQPPKLQSIGKYELITRLAIGGMAEIFLARESGVGGLERLVVIKRILPHLSLREDFVGMFLREARIVARLNHPNVVQIYELGESAGSYYIVMEYLHGSTARELQLLAREAGLELPFGVSIGIVAEAARGLHAAHELKDLEGRPLGLVHRDITPHNLMIDPEGHVKLLDFGIAKGTEGLDSTYSGSLKGKFPYMSPEMCHNDPLDRRADLFSLGIVLWELLTGEKLFRRDSEMAIMKAITEEPIPSPSAHLDHLPAEVEAVVMKALQVKPEDRYESADDMRKELLSSAQACGLDYSLDAIAQFITKVAGETLRERLDVLKGAMDTRFQSTSLARQRLLHQTASQIVGDDVATSVERPSASLPGLSSSMVKGDRWRTRLGAWRKNPLYQLAGFFLVGSVLAIMATLSVQRCLFGPRAETDLGATAARRVDGPPLAVCWPPYVDPEVLSRDLEVFRGYLEGDLGRPVPMTITESYAECAELLLSGEVSFAVLPPVLYVRVIAENPEVHLLALKQYEGSISYDGWLMVLANSSYRQLGDLAGRRFCFTDPDSSSGYFLPVSYIRQAGHDPEAFVGEVVWSGDHLQALRDILAGRCDVVATYNAALFSADAQGVPVGRLRFLTITGTVPQDVVVAGPTTTRGDRESFRRALLAFDPVDDLGLERLGEVERITGFSLVGDEVFDDLRRALLEHTLVQ